MLNNLYILCVFFFNSVKYITTIVSIYDIFNMNIMRLYKVTTGTHSVIRRKARIHIREAQTLKDILWKSAANSLSGNLPPNANTWSPSEMDGAKTAE